MVNDGLDDSAAATTTVTVHAIAAGDEHVLALKPNGALLAWGSNDDGGLGAGEFCGEVEYRAPNLVCAVGSTAPSSRSAFVAKAMAARHAEKCSWNTTHPRHSVDEPTELPEDHVLADRANEETRTRVRPWRLL